MGWSRRFFKGSKTICYLFPEANAFSILVVFGQKEVDRIEEIQKEENKFKETLHHGLKEFEKGIFGAPPSYIIP